MQSAIGFGQALLLAPGLLAAVEPERAVLCAVLLGVLLNALVVGGERRRPTVDRGQLGRLALAGLPAMAAGLLVLAAVDRPALQVAAGLVVLGALAARRAPAEPARSPARDVLAGAAAGVLTTTTSLNGPPLVLRLRGRPPAEVRDTTSAALLALNVAGAVLLVARGGGDGALLALALAPAVLLGHHLGRTAFARLDARRFEAAATALVALAGAASVLGGVT